MRHYKVTLSFEGRRYELDYWQGTGIKGAPRAADVIGSLMSDYNTDTTSFKNFCGEFGYDTDSRSAEQTFKQIKATKPKIKNLFGAKLGTFRRAEH